MATFQVQALDNNQTCIRLQSLQAVSAVLLPRNRMGHKNTRPTTVVKMKGILNIERMVETVMLITSLITIETITNHQTTMRCMTQVEKIAVR